MTATCPDCLKAHASPHCPEALEAALEAAREAEGVGDELRREIQRLRDGLRSLQGDPKTRVGQFEATRITSVAALNARIDRILNPGTEEREE